MAVVEVAVAVAEVAAAVVAAVVGAEEVAEGEGEAEAGVGPKQQSNALYLSCPRLTDRVGPYSPFLLLYRCDSARAVV